MSSPDLILYGVPFSQPVRAVIWLLLLNEQPFDLVPINPGSKGENGSRHPDYLAKNPAGTIPCLEERSSGFTLGEAHAILAYLCDRFGWSDWYPQDLQARARVNEVLNFHHRNLRDASGLVAPRIRKDLVFPEAVQQAARRTFEKALRTLENGYLQRSAFLAGERPTIADLGAYVEIGQLQSRFTNLYAFDELPRVGQWLEQMQQLPDHDTVHMALEELGDISGEAPSMDVIRNANKKSIVGLAQRVAQFG